MSTTIPALLSCYLMPHLLLGSMLCCQPLHLLPQGLHLLRHQCSTTCQLLSLSTLSAVRECWRSSSRRPVATAPFPTLSRSPWCQPVILIPEQLARGMAPWCKALYVHTDWLHVVFGGSDAQKHGQGRWVGPCFADSTRGSNPSKWRNSQLSTISSRQPAWPSSP